MGGANNKKHKRTGVQPKLKEKDKSKDKKKGKDTVKPPSKGGLEKGVRHRSKDIRQSVKDKVTYFLKHPSEAKKLHRRVAVVTSERRKREHQNMTLVRKNIREMGLMTREHQRKLLDDKHHIHELR